jgi:hypothetical protein
MEQKKEVKHIVYKITNIINGKIYIGKTKTHYGDGKPYGIKNRLKNHCRDAKSNIKGRGCPMLCNAIRKYGGENFSIEEILQCNENEIDDNEIEQIERHQSRNPNIGYNIALGGKGRSVVTVSEEIRKKISTDPDNMGFKEIYRNKLLIGYRARRKMKGIEYEKCFSSSEYTIEENKNKAIQWLENLKNDKIIGLKDYKKNKLPKNISEIKEDNKCVGYRINLMIKGKRIDKSFQSLTISLDKLLKDAEDYLKNKLENPDEKDPEDYNKKSNLPKNIVKVIEKGIHIGYRVKLIKNGVRVVDKMFQSRTTPLPELLEKAINYKNEYFDKYLDKVKIDK